VEEQLIVIDVDLTGSSGSEKASERENCGMTMNVSKKKGAMQRAILNCISINQFVTVKEGFHLTPFKPMLHVQQPSMVRKLTS
jgi:hypothetical protein